MSTSPYFEQHVFFCLNEREASAECCAKCDASTAFTHAKMRIKALPDSGEGKVRINKAGCLDRCGEGPVLVIYPEGVWYTYWDKDDIDEIIDSHVIAGKHVERLKI